MESPLILLADDHEDGREMYAEYLRAQKFRVVEARDGAEAVRLVIELRPAAVVLDIRMPEVDGIAATRLIRNDPRVRRTPILVLTAYDVDEQQALKAGANAVCVKPCMPGALVGLIRQLLEC